MSKTPPSEKVINFANACQNKLRKEIHKAYEEKLTRGQLSVLKVLVDYWHFLRNSCHPSIQTIARRAKYSERHVIGLIKELEDSGFITVERERVSGRSKPNKYSFTEKILSLTKRNVQTLNKVNSASKEQICQSLNSVHPNKRINNLITNNKNYETAQKEASNSCVFQKEVSSVRENPKNLKTEQRKAVQEQIKSDLDMQKVICLNQEKQQIISDIKRDFEKQKVFLKRQFLEKFVHKHGIQKLHNAIEAAQGYISRLVKAGKAHSKPRIVQAALNLDEPWWIDKTKQVELDAAKEAEKQKLKYKPLFDQCKTVVCPQTGHKVQLAPYMFFSPQYFYKKLNAETGQYEWFLAEGYMNIDLTTSTVELAS